MKAFIIAGAKCCRPKKKILQIKQSNKKRHVDGGLTKNLFLTLPTSGLVNKTSCHVRSCKRSPRIESGHDERSTNILFSALRTSTYCCQIRGRLRQVKKRLPDDLNRKLPEFTGIGQGKKIGVRN